MDFYIQYANDILRNLPPKVKSMKLGEFRDQHQMNWKRAIECSQQPAMVHDAFASEAKMPAILERSLSPIKPEQELSMQKNSVFSNMKGEKRGESSISVVEHKKQPFQSIQK